MNLRSNFPRSRYNKKKITQNKQFTIISVLKKFQSPRAALKFFLFDCKMNPDRQITPDKPGARDGLDRLNKVKGNETEKAFV